MTIDEAMTKAVKEGYHVRSFDSIEMYYSGANDEWSVWTRKDNDSSFMKRVEEIFLDPDFWSCLFGKKVGRKRALQMVDHLFEGGSHASFFAIFPAPSRDKLHV